MLLELKKIEEWAFFLFFIGGLLLIANLIVGVIVYAVMTNSFNTFYMPFLDGFGLFTIFVVNGSNSNLVYLGFTLNLIVGILALLIGLKPFITIFYNIITKIDLAFVGLLMFILGLGSFTLAGLILAAGGIFCFIYRMSVEGANNKTAKNKAM